ncbi:uncharacterized protein CEXT_167731 [Caerostris extrusa]|uniref:C2H2-type domain-containing protein n=1 Tax=Caerostris extrusa TaxID=172846 RepID=A0AAV4MMU1_CAEEX|nr:uncharacterized protein CEXT_167731 [Caerostris extrusa]
MASPFQTCDLWSLKPISGRASEVTVDVGFVCKKCHMVYPAEVLCLNHQRASCFQNKPVSEIKATLKLVQCHVECRACRERFTTIIDFKFHCDMDRHMKRVQKIQRGLRRQRLRLLSPTTLPTRWR